jgi:hypothetical protein
MNLLPQGSNGEGKVKVGMATTGGVTSLGEA